jgi:hypothetical protein
MNTLLPFEVWSRRALCVWDYGRRQQRNRLNPNLLTEFASVNTSHPT